MIIGRVEGPQKQLVMRRAVSRQVEGLEQAVPAIWLLDWPTPDVSSTEVRRRLRDGETIAGMVPELVEVYIRQYGLYGATPGGPSR